MPLRKNLKPNAAILTFFPLFIWFGIHCYLSSERSFWVDEWFRRSQMSMGFLGALKDLFSEISPFAPGEIILAYLNKALFSHFFSEELWMRLHSVYFGILTVWVALRCKEKILMPLVFFSVALTSNCTQFRPYSALVFGGALSFYLVQKKEKLDRVDQFFCWFNLFMGHIYGICFAGFAFFVRKDWLKMGASVAYVALVLLLHHCYVQPFNYDLIKSMPNASELFRQSLGTIGNPQKAAYFFTIFCGIGLWTLYKNQRKIFWPLLALLFLSTVGPIVATAIGNYYFMPRQVTGGTVIFLGISAIGIRTASDFLKRKKGKNFSLILLTLAVFVSAASWLAFVLGKPPFIDQPMHRFKQIAQEAKTNHYKNVLWLDSGTEGSALFYFKQVFDDPKATPSKQPLAGFTATKLCVANQETCLYIMNNDRFVWDAANVVQNHQVKALIDGKVIPFNAVVHGFYHFPLETRAKLLRIW